MELSNPKVGGQYVDGVRSKPTTRSLERICDDIDYMNWGQRYHCFDGCQSMSITIFIDAVFKYVLHLTYLGMIIYIYIYMIHVYVQDM